MYSVIYRLLLMYIITIEQSAVDHFEFSNNHDILFFYEYLPDAHRW